MPRLRVFEVAQQINKTNKEVLNYLKENNVNVKSHMSTLEEKDEKMVRDALGAKGDKNEDNKGADKKTVKKKSNLIGVFRPQNAQTQEGKNFRKKPAQGGQNRSQGQNRPQNTKSVAQRTEKPAQEVGPKTTSVPNPVKNQEFTYVYKNSLNVPLIITVLQIMLCKIRTLTVDIITTVQIRTVEKVRIAEKVKIVEMELYVNLITTNLHREVRDVHKDRIVRQDQTDQKEEIIANLVIVQMVIRKAANLTKTVTV